MRVFLYPLLMVLVFGFGFKTQAQTCTMNLQMTGTIGPASLDYLQRGLEKAQEKSCASLLLEINTPGGSLQTTRMIVEEILNSPIPVLCVVSPSGGRAGSAGAIIMQACHVSGALEGTNIGAATPVTGQGDLPDDIRKKLIEDTKSFTLSLAELRERNKDFAEKIVTEAKAVDAKEAAEVGAIDHLSYTIDDFLKFAEGREVKMSGQLVEKVRVGGLVGFDEDFRTKVLHIVTDPEVAYMMFMGSLGLLYFELTHPGAIIPGVVGGIGLIISMIAMHKLDVWWGGLALILLGLVLLVAEAFTPSFGFLGTGGIVSFIFGSIFLYNPAETGYSLPLGFILPTALILGGLMLAVAYFAYKTRSVVRRAAYDVLTGSIGKVVSLEAPSKRKGQITIQGEIWKFKSKEDLDLNAPVRVYGNKGLTLLVEPAKEE